MDVELFSVTSGPMLGVIAVIQDEKMIVGVIGVQVLVGDPGAGGADALTVNGMAIEAAHKSGDEIVIVTANEIVGAIVLLIEDVIVIVGVSAHQNVIVIVDVNAHQNVTVIVDAMTGEMIVVGVIAMIVIEDDDLQSHATARTRVNVNSPKIVLCSTLTARRNSGLSQSPRSGTPTIAVPTCSALVVSRRA